MVNVPTFALKGPRISKFRRRNPLKLETPNPDCVFFRSAWCALRAHSQAGGRSSSRASVQLWGESTKTQFGSETAFIRPFDPATYFSLKHACDSKSYEVSLSGVGGALRFKLQARLVRVVRFTMLESLGVCLIYGFMSTRKLRSVSQAQIETPRYT